VLAVEADLGYFVGSGLLTSQEANELVQTIHDLCAAQATDLVTICKALGNKDVQAIPRLPHIVPEGQFTTPGGAHLVISGGVSLVFASGTYSFLRGML